MEFNFIRFNENVLKKIIPNCYLGIGYSLEAYADITTIDSSDIFLYPNYKYILKNLNFRDLMDIEKRLSQSSL